MAKNYQSVYAEVAQTDAERVHPLDQAGLVSKILYNWASPLLSLGNQRQLNPEDIWPLQLENQCKVVSAAFEPTFQRTRSLLRTILTTYGWRFVIIGVLQVISVACTLYGPVVLKQILSALEGDTPFLLKGVLQLIGTLFLANVAQAFISAHSTFQNQLITVKLTSALQHLLFHKSLALDAKCRREKTAGEISNMFSADIQWILNFSIFANQVWLIPIQVAITLFMLYDVIGWATFVGAGVIVLMLTINNFVVVAQRRNFMALRGCQDKRMKSVNEVFGAMQIIKLNAWEEKFADKIAAERQVELDTLWRIFSLSSCVTLCLYAAPVLVAIASFATYTLVMDQTLTATRMFTALSLFNLLKIPLIQMPQIIANMMQALVALRRIMQFLDLEEKDLTTVWTPRTAPADALERYTPDKIDISIENASFGWTAESKPLFRDLNLTVKRGEFVIVHGSVGEGKSSLCAAILGEMEKQSGSIFVGGQVAYFSQQAWIQNLTIRENILFGKPYDRVKYNKVIEACALTKDLTLFAAGDRTEIGQKGVNLSGGQKARISLARACYSDADIFILDSPLSAVDAIVQNEIFTKCFLGLLRHKTIVLVTHCPEIIESDCIDRRIEITAGNLVETIVESKKHDSPALVDPLRVVVGFRDDDESPLNDHPPTWDMLLTPSVATPFPAHFDAMPFTPYDEATSHGGLTFDEVADSGRLVMEEERSRGRVDGRVFKSYLDAIGGWPRFAFWVFVLALWQGMSVASDLWLSSWSTTVDKVTRDEFHNQAGFYLGVYAALAIGSVLMTMVRTLSIYASSVAASRRLFANMTAALLRAPMRFFDANPIGRILNRYSNDVGTVDSQIPYHVSGSLAVVFMALFSFGTTIWVLQWVGLLLLPLIYLYFVMGQFYVEPAREMERVNKTTKSPLLNLISESIEGALVIRAFGPKQVRRFQRMHYRNVDHNNEASFATQVISQWFAMRIQLLSATLLLLISTSLIYMRQYLNPGLIGLVLNYSFTVLPSFQRLVSTWGQVETAMVGPERLAEYANIEPEAPRVISGAVAKSWPTTGEVEFDKMSFRYKENDQLVLRDVNVHIQSGEKIGIVGRTGAGKSSLTMALFRINELAVGSIKIDGVDISKIGVKTLRSAIAIIPQAPVLFNGTLRNYLDPFGEFTDDELWSCLRKVVLADRIASVEGNLDSPVEENGENFSVGERQMLCMARALLRQARIVVMDEATAAIDHETDQNLQRVIRTEFASSTVLTIAHRLDTVLDCDRILVFDQGRLVQCDSPKSLIEQGTGIFFELCSEGGYLDKLVVPQ
ncbi:unnamed protein product [Aphanomyces euteiches]|uniref:Multidrug resistance-associated protein 1 n=1 Tax=Aphanomyces euteiches TaxID=100861 RepID=A0A6G0XHD5_9STRA|nr:hypothetical protein Ae201684_004810 [Aphanomyces euteiches]KAH9073242.1 hypothetical protein Ae201684P_015059 [Aphanomyces euteiches]